MDQSKGGTKERTIITKDDAIRIGIGLQPILKQEGFQAALDILKLEISNRITSTLPHQTHERELAYLEHRCLDNLVSTLNSFVAIAEHDALVKLAYEDE